jgi:hypothetical protein
LFGGFHARRQAGTVPLRAVKTLASDGELT